MSNIVQYVLIRSDLFKEMGWSIGALIAQACHASTAALHLYKDDPQTIQYLQDLDSMHKVVLEEMGWSIGALIAQACHASTAALHLYKDDPQTIQYLQDLDSMHKVVLEIFVNSIEAVGKKAVSQLSLKACFCHTLLYVMRYYIVKDSWSECCGAMTRSNFADFVPNEESLTKLSSKLEENSISHKMWMEQPENIPTCIALKPYVKEEVKKYVGKFKLYKTTV